MVRKLYRKGKKFSKRFTYLATALVLVFASLGIDLILFHPHKVGATTFTTSGTWTVPAGQNSATFEAWGAGGGGGAATGTIGLGTGGAGGQYASSTIAVTPGDIYTVTVAPSTPGGTFIHDPGNIGQDSSVTSPSSSTVVLAKGGGGGDEADTTTANGTGTSVGAVGQVAYGNGGAGGTVGNTSSGAGGGGAGSTGWGGDANNTTAGTGTTLNGGNGGAGLTANGGGNAGSNYGGGGSGGWRSSGPTKNGGNGAQGLVVITPSTSIVTSKIRQEINILDSNLAVSSTSNAIVQLDTTQYSGTATYFFEVVTNTSSASTDSVTLTRKGTTTNDATVTLAGTGIGVRVRSASFTPPAGQTEYVVKTGANHALRAARIIVLQSETAGSFSSSETQDEIGTYDGNTLNNTASSQIGYKYWKYEGSSWKANTQNFFAEVTKSQSGTSFNTTVTLQQDDGTFGGWTDVATIVNANTTSAATRFRVSFTPKNGRYYRLAGFESSAGANTYNIYNGKIIIDQSGSVTKLQPQYLIPNYRGSVSGVAGFPTLFDTDWSGTGITYYYVVDVRGFLVESVQLIDIDRSNKVLTTISLTGSAGTDVLTSSAILSLPTGDQLDINSSNNPSFDAVKINVDVVTGDFVNSAPAAPTLSSPTSGATGVSTAPSFTLKTTDGDFDFVRYRIYLYQSDCSTPVGASPFNQNISETGWTGQDTDSGNSYQGDAVLASSTTATYTYQGQIQQNTTFCWKADAIDPSGSNSFGSASATQLFTTGSATGSVNINGGVQINGGTTIQ